MGHFPLSVLAFFAIVAVCHGTLMSELYWNAVFPNTPIPRTIADHLPRDEMKIAQVTVKADAAEDAETGVIIGPYGNPITVDRTEKPFLYYPTPDPRMAAAANPYGKHGRIDNPMALGFFLEKDLRASAKMSMRFQRTMSGDSFLPRPLAESIAFSSGQLPQILSRFSIRPSSMEAERMLKALLHCEWPAIPGERKHCATSLESMVDFVVHSLGTRELRPMTTTADKELPEQLYTVLSWAPAPTSGTTAAICHVPVYPYTVFHCHMMPGTKPYTVKLAGENGAMVEAAAMCHTNTWAYARTNNSPWDPMRRALKAFGVKAGTTLCHLVPEGDVLWVPVGKTSA